MSRLSFALGVTIVIPSVKRNSANTTQKHTQYIRKITSRLRIEGLKEWETASNQ